MRGARILGMGHYVPERVVTNDDLSKFLTTNDEWIVQRTGIRERRWVVPRSAGECRSPLQAAKLRLLLCFLHSDRLTQRCPLALRGGRVPQTIADWFRAKVSAGLEVFGKAQACAEFMSFLISK